jgi:hypothetical protein
MPVLFLDLLYRDNTVLYGNTGIELKNIIPIK